MEALPDEVLVEIFRWLRKKPSCRCKCVSKRWRDLISEFWGGGVQPRLCNSGCLIQDKAMLEHKDVFDDTGYSVFFFRLDEEGGMTPEESLDFKEWTYPSNMASCNGLLFYCLEHGGEMQYGVADPVTKESVLLPLYPNSSLASTSELPAALGFALDSESGHWKLIAVYVFDIRIRTRVGVAIFDSEAGEWRLCIWVLDVDFNWRKTFRDPVPVLLKLPDGYLSDDGYDDDELDELLGQLMCFCEEFHIIHIRLSYKFACYDIAERKVTPFDFPISLDSLDVAVSSSAMRYYLTEWTFNESNGRAKLPDCGTNRRLTVDDKSGKRSYERGLGSCSQGKWSVYISPTQIFRVLSIRLDEIREHNILLEEMQHQREERDRKIKGRLCLMNAHLRILEECVEAPNSIIRSCSSQGSIDGEFIGETQLDTTRDRGPVLDDVFHGHYGENERGLGSGWCQGECIIYTEMFCELLTQLDERREHIIQLQEIERQSEEWDRATEARLDLLDEQFRMLVERRLLVERAEAHG